MGRLSGVFSVLNHPPYLATIGNQLAWIGIIDFIAIHHSRVTTKEHFENKSKRQVLKTNYVKVNQDTSGNVLSLFSKKERHE